LYDGTLWKVGDTILVIRVVNVTVNGTQVSSIDKRTFRNELNADLANDVNYSIVRQDRFARGLYTWSCAAAKTSLMQMIVVVESIPSARTTSSRGSSRISIRFVDAWMIALREGKEARNVTARHG
jgi:hypothetical protein